MRVDPGGNSPARSAPRPTVFLDRDGVINRRWIDDYVTDWDRFQLLDGAVAAICRLHRAGLRLAVVTNQRGIALGRMSRETVTAIHRKLRAEVVAGGGELCEFYVCGHDNGDGCDCRKPKPGLLDQANAFAPVDWCRSLIVGDSDRDILAGHARGVTCVKVAGPSQAEPHHTCADLAAAADWIIARAAGSACVSTPPGKASEP